MEEQQKKPISEEDARLQREVRADRKFTLAEAIGRMAGGGLLKGVSPISPKQQAEGIIEDFLRHNLTDTGGVLVSVILRQVGHDEGLITNAERPLDVLAECIRHVLASEFRLSEVVREADMDWGRVFGERPYFDRPGCDPDPNDPYTIESVRQSLTRLLEKLVAVGSVSGSRSTS